MLWKLLRVKTLSFWLPFTILMKPGLAHTALLHVLLCWALFVFFFSLGYSLFSVLQRNTYSIQACFLVAFVCLIYSCLRREKRRKTLKYLFYGFFPLTHALLAANFFFYLFFFSLKRVQKIRTSLQVEQHKSLP